VNSKRMPPSDADKPKPPGGKHDWIARQLRRVYDEALQEEIPPEMLRLLDQLDEKDPEAPA
jgi:hypothetical protein